MANISITMSKEKAKWLLDYMKWRLRTDRKFEDQTEDILHEKALIASLEDALGY